MKSGWNPVISKYYLLYKLSLETMSVDVTSERASIWKDVMKRRKKV